MSNPHVALDPDPLTAIDVAELESDAWDRGYAAAESDRRWRTVGIVLAAIAGGILGFFIAIAVASAAPRPAPDTAPTSVVGRAPDQGSTGAPRSGMPVEAAAEASREDPTKVGRVGAPGAIESGVVAYAAPSFGDRYLAVPEGPGVRVRICSSSSLCLDRISTDAGPDLAMQRAGRIADVSFVDFAWLCRCDPPGVGLIHATIETAGPGITPPPTDIEP